MTTPLRLPAALLATGAVLAALALSQVGGSGGGGKVPKQLCGRSRRSEGPIIYR